MGNDKSPVAYTNLAENSGCAARSSMESKDRNISRRNVDVAALSLSHSLSLASTLVEK